VAQADARARGAAQLGRLHDLRHTAATYWLIRGEPLYFVQKQLGHRDSNTTEHYEHMAASYLAERADRHDDALWLSQPSRQEAPA
jgi:integrase